MTKRVLITGAGGMLGSYMTSRFGPEAYPLTFRDLDIADTGTFRRLLQESGAKWVINCAGISFGEESVQQRINAEIPMQLATVCRDLDVGFVFISTSRVFAGSPATPRTEDVVPTPIDAYAHSKREGEKHILEILKGRPHYVVRLPMVLGYRRHKSEKQIVTRLLQEMNTQPVIRVARDVYHTPVHGTVVASFVQDLLHTDAEYGIHHATSVNRTSLYELMQRLVRQTHRDVEVLAVDAMELGHDNAPKNLCLETRSEYLESWEEATDRLAQECLAEDGQPPINSTM